jgi:Flp pilus assembly protein TadG
MRSRQSRKARKGAVLVESAVVLMCFLVLVLGTLDYGLAVLRYNALSEAARRLARAAIIHGEMAAPETTCWGPTSYVGNAADGSEFATTVQPALVAMSAEQVNIQLEWPDGGNRLDQRVQVTVSYEHHSAIPSIFGSSTLQLRAASLMRIVH